MKICMVIGTSTKIPFLSVLIFSLIFLCTRNSTNEKQIKKIRALKKKNKENNLVQKFKIIPLCRHRRHFAGGHSLNCDDVVFADRMHRQQFVRCP